jgi:glutamate carboxypeptidase
MLDPTELHASFRERLPSVLTDIEEVVNIDSGSYFAPGVTQVTQWVGRRLEALGFSLSFESLPSRGDRLVAVRSQAGRGNLMILGHADTVWPNGTAAEWPFAVKDDWATGPGVGDMKSGLVMAINALDILGKRAALGFETIRYVLASDEELGSPACRSWIEYHARQSDWVLVLEPTRPGGGMVTSRGAVGAFFITAHGVSAHAAVDYRKGVSAVRALAKVVGPVEGLTDLDAGVIVNVGRFDGGTARQVIPENASLHLDVLARTPDQQQAVLDAIESLVAKANGDGARVTLSGGWTRPSWPVNPGSARLYEYGKQTSDVLGLTTFEMPTVSGGSDGSFCGALGIPTLDAMGPECNDICSRRETIRVASIADRGAIFAGVIARLCGQ